MSKAWSILRGIFFVTGTSLFTIFAAAVAGALVANDYPYPPSDAAMRESLLWTVLTCIACIALSFILFVRKEHNIALGEMLALVCWPLLFIWNVENNLFLALLPQEVVVPLFLALIFVTFGRIRYQIRKAKAISAR